MTALGSTVFTKAKVEGLLSGLRIEANLDKRAAKAIAPVRKAAINRADNPPQLRTISSRATLASRPQASESID